MAGARILGHGHVVKALRVPCDDSPPPSLTAVTPDAHYFRRGTAQSLKRTGWGRWTYDAEPGSRRKPWSGACARKSRWWWGLDRSGRVGETERQQQSYSPARARRYCAPISTRTPQTKPSKSSI